MPRQESRVHDAYRAAADAQGLGYDLELALYSGEDTSEE